jgi:hypothetical protein
MKKGIASMSLSLSLASAAFAVDEYLPIEAGKFRVDVGYMYAGMTGMYDEDGEKQDVFEGSGNMVPVQLKYGILPGLDVEAVWAFASTKNDLGSFGGIDLGEVELSGFGQPEIALKYALMDVGAGAFVNFIAPFATGDFADPETPPMALQFGAVYSKLFGKFRAGGQIDYQLNFEKDDAKEGNIFSIFLKPEFQVHEYGSLYAGVVYDLFGESEFDGTGQEDDGNLLTLMPGWNASWTPLVATEVNVPITVMGKSAPSAWGIQAKLRLTLPM